MCTWCVYTWMISSSPHPHSLIKYHYFKLNSDCSVFLFFSFCCCTFSFYTNVNVLKAKEGERSSISCLSLFYLNLLYFLSFSEYLFLYFQTVLLCVVKYFVHRFDIVHYVLYSITEEIL